MEVGRQENLAQGHHIQVHIRIWLIIPCLKRMAAGILVIMAFKVIASFITAPIWIA